MSSSCVTVGAFAEHDADLHLVLEVLGGNRDRGAFDDVGVLGDERLDLERRDVLTAPPDRVLEAVDEVVVALLVVRGTRRRCGTNRCAKQLRSPPASRGIRD